MIRSSVPFLAFIVFVCCAVTDRLVTAAETDDAALPQFDYDFSVRYRHESVTQDNALENAAASTARSRLTLTLRPVEKIRALLEIDNVSTVGPDDYDSFIINEYRGNHSVIADPTGTEINQLLLGYTLAEGKQLTVGRQRLVHAGQRFVGGVAWRQNEQTYDAATYSMRSSAVDMDYSYVAEVQRIFNGSGDSVQATYFDSDTHLFTASLKQDWGKLSAYAYALDFDNAPAASTLTYGLSWSGKVGPLDLNASLAHQQDYADNPMSFDAMFYAVDGATQLGPVKLLLGYEVLGSDDGNVGFATPLATLHIFQGWADMFLATPADGIEDAFFSLSGKAAGLSLAATYHDFSAAEGSRNYGSEWDLIASYPFNEMFSAALKYANFSSDGFAVDTEKLWFTLDVSF